MQRMTTSAISACLAAGLMFAGCAPDPGSDTTGDATGFTADAVVGVLLPEPETIDAAAADLMFGKGLEEAGFEADVQFQNRSLEANQRAQVEAMIDDGAEVLVIGDVHVGRLREVLQEARDAGIAVIAYDRLSAWGDLADYGVAVDRFRVGQIQGQALLDGLAARYPEQSTYTVELFSGAPSQDDDTAIFDGAMSVLQARIDDGTLAIVSGEVSRPDTDTEHWRESSLVRMDELLESTYKSQALDGVLAPNDLHAQAIIESVQDHGRDLPVVVGQGSEPQAVSSMLAGAQYATTYTDERVLVERTIEMIQELQTGDDVTTTNPADDADGPVAFPTNLQEPLLVTRENAADAFADDPDLAPLTQR